MFIKAPSFTNSTPFAHLPSRRALLLWIREFLEKNAVSGCYYEFGVFQGESLKEAYYCLRNQVDSFVGLDSFKGLPKPQGIDAEGIESIPHFVEGNYKSFGLDFVQSNILSSGLDANSLLLIEGFYEFSLTPELKSFLYDKGYGKASVIHLDVDLHSSTLQALEFSYDFMQTGSWLLCDDYWCYRGSSRLGTQKAITDFLQAHPDIRFQEYCSYQGWSKSFIIERIED